MKRWHAFQKFRIRNSLGTALLLIRLTCLLHGLVTPAGASGEAQTRVLTIYGMRKDIPAIEIIEKVLRKGLSDGLTGNLDHYSEYMDVPRSTRPDYQEALRDFLRRKYEHQEFNLIIPVGETAIEFVAQYGAELFPGSPVVFLGSGERETAALHLGPNATGVSPEMDMKSTLDLVLELQPGTKRVVVFSGASELDRYYERLARRQFQEFDGRLAFTYLCGLPLEDALKAAANLPHDSIIYFLTISEDGAGRRLIPREALEKMAPLANVPMYGWIETELDHGVLGGSLFSPEALAHQLAELALRVLRGEKPHDIGIIKGKANINLVDWRQLQRWGISEKKVPTGSVVRFKEPSFWERYKWHISGVLALCVLEALLISLLLVERAKVQRSTAALHESEERSRAILQAIPDLMYLFRADGVCLDFRAKNPGELWVPPEKLIGKNMREVLPSELAEEFTRCFRRALEANRPQSLEYNLEIDGEVHYYEARTVRSGGDKLLTIVRDVTSWRRAEKESQQLSTRLFGLQDSERQRISRELHDVTAQNLFVITINLARLRQSGVAPEIEKTLAECQTLCEQSLQEIRTISYRLQPPMLDQAGLVPAVQWFIDGFSKRSGMDVGLVVPHEIDPLPKEIGVNLFHVIQESLANAQRHSGSSTATVRLERQATQIVLQIKDQGRGIPGNPATAERDGVESGGVGIRGMKERLRQLGGRLEIESSEQGTTVLAILPLPAQQILSMSAGQGQGS